jgi:hypothetical protein
LSADWVKEDVSISKLSLRTKISDFFFESERRFFPENGVEILRGVRDENLCICERIRGDFWGRKNFFSLPPWSRAHSASPLEDIAI